MSNDKEINEIYNFLYSSKCDLYTPKDKAIRLDAGGLNESIKREDLKHLNIEKDHISIEQTKGGQKLVRLIEWSNLTDIERAFIWQDAQLKYLSQASGNLTVVLLGERGHSAFHMAEMPVILANEKISSLNHIEKRQFDIALNHDRSPGKIDSHDRIRKVITGQEGMHYLIGKDRAELHMDDAITYAVRKDFGDRVDLVQKEYKRTNMVILDKFLSLSVHEAKEKALGKRAKFFWNAVPNFIERWKLGGEGKEAIQTHRKAVTQYKDLILDLGRKENLKRIRYVANEFLQKFNEKLTIGDTELKHKVERSLEVSKHQLTHRETIGKLHEFVRTMDEEQKLGKKR